ncbi:hypothetical protein U9M48_012906 [Paspalum notatum var. saurae]|uniref:Uncharacterized protein n=1 Tax=Paspalum notatum var. saurae TaxID=547442 RepID=A0AAQ3WIS9_PASNO
MSSMVSSSSTQRTSSTTRNHCHQRK